MHAHACMSVSLAACTILAQATRAYVDVGAGVGVDVGAGEGVEVGARVGVDVGAGVGVEVGAGVGLCTHMHTLTSQYFAVPLPP